MFKGDEDATNPSAYTPVPTTIVWELVAAALTSNIALLIVFTGFSIEPSPEVSSPSSDYT